MGHFVGEFRTSTKRSSPEEELAQRGIWISLPILGVTLRYRVSYEERVKPVDPDLTLMGLVSQHSRVVISPKVEGAPLVPFRYLGRA